MTNINIQPMQWNPIIDITEVSPFTEEGDKELFSDIRDVLKKHNALNRFGISLIHKHFDISEDECLLECTDIENRTLLIKPVKNDEIEDSNSTVTQWRFTDNDSIATANCICYRSGAGHEGRHARV